MNDLKCLADSKRQKIISFAIAISDEVSADVIFAS